MCHTPSQMSDRSQTWHAGSPTPDVLSQSFWSQSIAAPSVQVPRHNPVISESPFCPPADPTFSSFSASPDSDHSSALSLLPLWSPAQQPSLRSLEMASLPETPLLAPTPLELVSKTTEGKLCYSSATALHKLPSLL